MSFILVPRRSKRFGPVSVSSASDEIISASRKIGWQPGVTFNGGIPNRTTIFSTVPVASGLAAVQAAIDSCPPNQVVQIGAGTLNVSASLTFRNTNNNITLRGAGPGDGGGTGTLTKLNCTGGFIPLISIDGGTFREYDRRTSLTANAFKGDTQISVTSATGFTVGDIVVMDMDCGNGPTSSHPDVHWGKAVPANAPDAYGWFSTLPHRALGQYNVITAINGTTFTLERPLYFDFTTANTTQISNFLNAWCAGIGIEDLYCNNGGASAINMTHASKCWIKHVECDFNRDRSVQFFEAWRCEVRDSYIHGTPDPNPGGGGYMIGIDVSGDCLVENCISRDANKVDVVRGLNSGHVISYCYATDSYGSTYKSSPEAGINAGHMTCPAMCLLEGNYSHNYKGDSFWGNSIDITVWRNHLTGLRPNSPNLGLSDIHGRACVDIQAYSIRHNFVGNVLGFSGMPLLSGDSITQDQFVYEWDAGAHGTSPPDTTVSMWRWGIDQSPEGAALPDEFPAGQIATIQRDGNWDWFTQSQRWHGIGGTGAGAGTPKTIVDSLYLSSKPAWFGGAAWPWVNPSNGSTTALPAKARFDAGDPNNLSIVS